MTGRRVFLPHIRTLEALFDDNLTSSTNLPSFFHLNMRPMASQMSAYVSKEVCSSKLNDMPIRVGTDVNTLTKNNMKTFMMEVCKAQTMSQGTTCQVMFNCSYNDVLTLFVGFPKGGMLSVSEFRFHSLP